MKKRTLLSGIVFAAACFAESGMELYQKAVTQERAGKMDEAIRLYEKVAHDFASDRALAAKALLAAARDYEKLGEDNAVKLYERVVRDYGDQREFAATANARLAALRQAAPTPPATMTQRRIQPLGDSQPFTMNGMAAFYTDGQRAVYLDSGVLVISGLDRSRKRTVYKPKQGESFAYFVPSRDLSMVYLRLLTPDGQVTHAVSKMDGTGYRELFQGWVYGATPPAWSWDNRYLLLSGVPPAPAGSPYAWADNHVAIGGGIVAISVADGMAREIVRRETSIQNVALSPDGRFIAFAEREPRQLAVLKIRIAPFQGGEARLISEDAMFLDWTRDGRYLATYSQRSGSEAMYLTPIQEGQPSGDPVFVRYGSFAQGDTQANGSLVYRSVATKHFVATIAALDSSGHSGAWKPLDLEGLGDPFPSWSPDSAAIVYFSSHEDAGQPGGTVRVRSTVTGEDREVYRSTGLAICGWEALRPNLFCLDGVLGEKQELLSVAVDSSRVERLGPAPQLGIIQGLAALAREKGIEILPEVAGPLVGGSSTRLVNRRDVEIRATRDGDWKRLVTLNSAQSDVTLGIGFSSDGKWVFYTDKDSVGKDAIFRIPAAGGKPERSGDLPPQSGWTIRTIRPSPDGRNILLLGAMGSATDTWLLENFEPKPAAAAR